MSDTRRVSLYIGRWQPFHSGHKWIIDQALNQGKRVCIGIRDTPVTSSDPYTYEQRVEMLRRVYQDKVEVMRFPDIESINIGRGVGYEVNYIDAPKDIQAISATGIRAGKQSALPEEVEKYLKLMGTTVWFTGLPCSGKTTFAKACKDRLTEAGYNVVILDGDDVRKGLCQGLGFTEEEREENLRRVANVAELFNNNKTIVLASFVSPTVRLRTVVRSIISNLKLVYISCPVEECERRDTKGMYAKARAGEIKEFTGVSAPYEPPTEEEGLFLTFESSHEKSINEYVDRLCACLGVD